MSASTREVELKARVDDLVISRGNIERAGAVLMFQGTLRDRIYDSTDRALTKRDHVLRLRSYESDRRESDTHESGQRIAHIVAHLEWKGPTSREDGFKVREELATGVSDPAALAELLGRLGYEVVRAIDRRIAQYELTPDGGERVVVRFEQYPRMDVLVEVEGPTGQIERTIELLQIPRAQFSADSLTEFVRAYESRTGSTAAISDADFAG